MSSQCNYSITCGREFSLYIHDFNSFMLMTLTFLIPVQTTLSLKLKICWRSLLGWYNSASNSSYPKQNITSPPTPRSSFPFPHFSSQWKARPPTHWHRPESWEPSLGSRFLPLHTQEISASSMAPSSHLICHPPLCESDSSSELWRL